MSNPALWDEQFLKQHDRSERIDAIAALTDSDWQAAVQHITRKTSDALHGYQTCPAAKCRRARRCIGDGERCVEQLEEKLPPDVEEAMIRSFYARIQRARRRAAAEQDAG